MLPVRTFCVLASVAILATVSAAASPVEVLIAEGRADEAITSLQQRTQSSPNDAEAFNLLCRTYFALGDWNRGIPNCEKAAKLEANNARYHLWLGRIYGEKADAANFFSAASLAGKVRTEFEAAVKLSPDNVDAHTDLAEFYLEAPGIVGGGRDKAEAEARVLDKLDPGKAHWVRARMAQKAKDSATAEKEYRAAIEASKGSANAWLNLALFYRRIGRLNEMEDALNHAVSARSNEPQVLPEAAETLIRAERNFPTAIEWLRRYLASNSKVEEVPAFKAHYLLGTVLEKQGDKKAAAQEYSAALSLAKDYSRARQALERVNR